MGQLIANFRKPPKPGEKPAKEILDHSLFDLSPGGKEKIDSIAAWRQNPHSDNVPVVNSPPPPTLVGCAD
jgi:hypothetical protein